MTDAQEILPSGVIALHGRAGEHARQLLEERRWLYKHLYVRPPFRVVERVARGIITLWVLHFVTKKVIEEARAAELGVKPLDLNDVRAIKGVTARELLWDRLKRTGGEPEMIVAMADDLANLDGAVAPRCKEWIGDCREVVQSMLTHKGEEADSGIERKLRRCATWSQRMYVGAVDLPRIGEIVRELEVKTPFSGMIDIARMPRMLAYPSRRRFDLRGAEVIGECFAVSHRDPDRWGKKTGSWVPLSESAYAGREAKRWAQILILGPRAHDDSNVRHLEDRFRAMCARERISVLDEDPDSPDTGEVVGRVAS